MTTAELVNLILARLVTSKVTFMDVNYHYVGVRFWFAHNVYQTVVHDQSVEVWKVDHVNGGMSKDSDHGGDRIMAIKGTVTLLVFRNGDLACVNESGEQVVEIQKLHIDDLLGEVLFQRGYLLKQVRAAWNDKINPRIP
mgnify:CR=1 FL=1